MKKNKYQRQHSYWQSLYMAFYSKALYVDVVRSWRGSGLIYLFVLVAITLMPLSTRFCLDLNRQLTTRFFMPFKRLPPITIHQGKLVSTSQDKPVLVKDSFGHVIAMIDPVGVGRFDDEHPDLALLVTSHRIYFRPPVFESWLFEQEPSADRQIYEQTLSTLPDGVFNGKHWVNDNTVLRLKYIGLSMVYPVMVSLVFGFALIVLLSLTLLVQLYVRMMFKLRLSYQATSRLLVVSATPMMFFCAFLGSLVQAISYTHWLGVLLLVGYLNYAALSVRSEPYGMVIA